jgi:hypothetical protein
MLKTLVGYIRCNWDGEELGPRVSAPTFVGIRQRQSGQQLGIEYLTIRRNGNCSETTPRNGIRAV